MPYLLNESAAIKEKLSTLRVTASTYPGGKTVPVHFVEPDYELANAEYPGIYISYGNIRRATEREHRGPILLPYAPEGFSAAVQVPADMDDKANLTTVPWLVDENSIGDPHASPYFVQDSPVPYDIGFDIAVLTRNYSQTMELVAALAQIQYIPERFGFLEVPEDGTIRTLELTGGPEVTTPPDKDGKRVVQTLYSVRVASELSLYQVQQVVRTEAVDVSLTSI